MTPSEPSRTDRPDTDGAGDRRVLDVLDVAVRTMGGSPRQGQTTMAREVAQTLADGTHLLVQAGTGTGKSLGYLVPAMVHAVETGDRVVVSTATLALQRQILTKDAPLAADAVEQVTGTRPEVALLKGWQNYLCRHRLAGGYPQDDDDAALFDVGDAVAQPVAGHGAEASLGEQVVRLREWAADTDTGDRDDLVPGVSSRAWAQVSVSRADLVITNHAMLGVVVAGNPGVLPDHQVLVVDEAHELADRVRSQGTIALSATTVARTAATARKHASVTVGDLEAAGQVLQLVLAELPDGRLEAPLPAALHDALLVLDDAARQVASDVRDRVRARTGEASGGLAIARTSVGDLVDALDRMTSDSVVQGRDVAWIERPRMGADPPRLLLAPIEVAGSVAGHLLGGRSSVMTSATLALGNSFDPMARALGLPLAEQPWKGVDVGSPFDYPRQGILYVAAHLPRPGAGISEAALDEMLSLVEASGGGMLGLFSSRRAAQEAAEVLRGATDLPVYAQGEDQLPTLVRAFADDEAACLVGSLSLWQGVDVPGRTCRLVVIDRIPFPRPDDPVAQARSDAVVAAGGNGFMSVAATHAALLLAQGAGRLIRRGQDRGVVAVLDSRLRTARYSGFLTRSMPALWPTTKPDVVRAALRRLSARPDAPGGE